MSRRLPYASILLLGASLSLAACASSSDHHDMAAMHSGAAGFAKVTDAVAVMHPTAGNNVHGTVRFHQADDGVHVVADVTGLTPNSSHGFHIHEFGDATAANGTSAGGHYNPEGHPHAGPDTAMRHAGDLGNLQSDASGHAHKEMTVTNITVAGSHDPVIGRGVVIHAGTDDLKTQPTGNAGGRVAVGVIGVANPADQ